MYSDMIDSDSYKLTCNKSFCPLGRIFSPCIRSSYIDKRLISRYKPFICSLTEEFCWLAPKNILSSLYGSVHLKDSQRGLVITVQVDFSTLQVPSVYQAQLAMLQTEHPTYHHNQSVYGKSLQTLHKKNQEGISCIQ